MFNGINFSKILSENFEQKKPFSIPQIGSEGPSLSSSSGFLHTLDIQKKIFPPTTQGKKETSSRFSDDDLEKSPSLSPRISTLDTVKKLNPSEEPPQNPKPSVIDDDQSENTQLHRVILFKKKNESFEHIKQEITRLLQSGIDPNIQNKNGDTILHLIAQLPYCGLKYDQLVQVLLNFGAKATIANQQGLTAFHQIISINPSLSIISMLIEKGLADVNAQDNEKNTALHRIAGSNPFNSLLANALLEYEANVNIENLEGDTPLHIAIRRQEDLKKVVRLFCNEANVNVQNKAGDTPLHLLAAFNQREPIEFLLNQGADKTLVNKKKQLPIHIAATIRRNKAIDLLCPSDNQRVNSKEQTLLHWAADNFDMDSEFDAFKRIFDLCKNVAAFDLFGNTPLYYAVDSGFYKAVEFLLENKSPTRTLNYKLDSPLHRAVEKLLDLSYTGISNRTQIKEIETLITVLHSARKGSRNRVRFRIDPRSIHLRVNDYKRIIDLLLDNESDPEQNNEKIKSPIDLCLDFIKKNSTTDLKDSYKRIYDELYPQGKLYIPCLPTLFSSSNLSASSTAVGQYNSSSSSH